jgi:hypothetical protein
MVVPACTLCSQVLGLQFSSAWCAFLLEIGANFRISEINWIKNFHFLEL